MLKRYIIAFSMGDVIASYFAAIYKVEKLKLLSTAFYYVYPKQLMFDCKVMIKDLLNGNINENERYKKKLLETPLRSTCEFQKLVKKVRLYLKNLTLPVLIIQGECDGIVPVELRLLPGSKHLVCYDEDYEKIKKYVEVFLCLGIGTT